MKCDNHCEDMLEVHSNSGKHSIYNITPIKNMERLAHYLTIDAISSISRNIHTFQIKEGKSVGKIWKIFLLHP